jgi:hypothetical protein
MPIIKNFIRVRQKLGQLEKRFPAKTITKFLLRVDKKTTKIAQIKPHFNVEKPQELFRPKIFLLTMLISAESIWIRLTERDETQKCAEYSAAS